MISPIEPSDETSVQFSSVAQSCLTLCDPMDCTTPGFPVHHQLLALTQTHVYWVGDAIQPSHPLSSPSPCTFNLSQHQGLFQSQFFASGGQGIGASVSVSASVPSMNIQDWFPLGLTGLISLQSMSRPTQILEGGKPVKKCQSHLAEKHIKWDMFFQFSLEKYNLSQDFKINIVYTILLK